MLLSPGLLLDVCLVPFGVVKYFNSEGRLVPTAYACNMKVSGEVRPILLKNSIFLKWLEFDWNGRREERQHWACRRDSVGFRMPQGCKASLISFFSWWNKENRVFILPILRLMDKKPTMH
jgi:hypothetical protein